MAQDLRDLFKNKHTNSTDKMKVGHEDRFLRKLEKELPAAKKPPYFIWKVAASVAVLIGIGLYFFTQDGAEPVDQEVVGTDHQIEQDKTFSLGDLSPDLKKVEDYYVSTINLELSKLELTESNKGLVDSYLEQLSELDEEYKKLNIELNEIGPNDQTINALIKNLQLRLQLLHKLKNKLNELKSSENEQDIII
ncbi:MAG: hypothetical protein ACR2MT_00180 [Aurantibacter sp.]